VSLRQCHAGIVDFQEPKFEPRYLFILIPRFSVILLQRNLIQPSLTQLLLIQVNIIRIQLGFFLIRFNDIP
jgi:hypothetical protein